MQTKAYPIPPSSEITPESLYRSRRQFIKMAGAAGLAFGLAACGFASETGIPTNSVSTPIPDQDLYDELGDPANSFEEITHFNNFYEFSQGKENIADLAGNFTTSPWSLEITGLVNNPLTYTLDDLLTQFETQERIYRLRCVEAWSMVIPWQGFPLADLLDQAGPMTSAKYVRFVSAADKNEMPGLSNQSFPWPYMEGLRLDEAMNDLTILATGLYGQDLPPQDGAPIRLVVPWKYGFKSAKSLVRIELVEDQPATFWNSISPNEYGFYSNVNPNLSHPRWSQASERRIGETTPRKTLLFNGYADQVESIYSGMDLTINY